MKALDALLVAAVLAGCVFDGSSGEPDLVRLRSSVTGVGTRVEGNGIACGTSASCDGTVLDTCDVMIETGTRVELRVIHPTCPPNAIYFTFAFEPPCEASSGRFCAFTIEEDTVVIGQGVSAAR